MEELTLDNFENWLRNVTQKPELLLTPFQFERIKKWVSQPIERTSYYKKNLMVHSLRWEGVGVYVGLSQLYRSKDGKTAQFKVTYGKPFVHNTKTFSIVEEQ